MASRHHSLDLSEIADVTDMLCGFEEHNTCTIQMTVTVENRGKVRGLVIEAVASGIAPNEAVARPLASVSVRCSDMNLKAWNSALTHVLYALDFKLALEELGHAAPKRA